MIHSIDLHAVTGPGGGAAATQAPPGETKSFRFKALNPGLYVYHCATPMVANHISSGMYGLILVEPPGGLSKVDHEFYVMQGELYTDRPYGQRGHDEFSVEKLLNERAEYFVFNGAVGADSGPRAKVVETIRSSSGGGPKRSPRSTSCEILPRVHQLRSGSPTSTELPDYDRRARRRHHGGQAGVPGRNPRGPCALALEGGSPASDARGDC